MTKTNALESLVIAGFVRGLSTRDVEATLVEALGEQAAVSKSTVSRAWPNAITCRTRESSAACNDASARLGVVMSSRASHSASRSAISSHPEVIGAATPPAAMTVCTASVWATALSTWIPAT